MNVKVPNPVKADAVRAWASDWADMYDQDRSEDDLRALVGKTVVLEAPPSEEGEAPRGVVINVVGYDIATIIIPQEEDSEEVPPVHRFTLLGSEGIGVPLFAKGTVEEFKE